MIRPPIHGSIISSLELTIMTPKRTTFSIGMEILKFPVSSHPTLQMFLHLELGPSQGLARKLTFQQSKGERETYGPCLVSGPEVA
jgi:hypothetical protein